MPLRDDFAHDLAEHRFGLPWCLHIPVAARDEASVHSHVGHVLDVVVSGTPSMALLIETSPPERMDASLPIWLEPGASNLHRSPQLWGARRLPSLRHTPERFLPRTSVTSTWIM